MSIYITSDLHFNHQNIIKYANRPFSSVEEMNQCLIKNWNDTVKKNDIVYIVGDFFMGRIEKISSILKKLNGYKYLIIGNHDTSKRQEIYKKHRVIVRKYDELYYAGHKYLLYHYPLIDFHKENKIENYILKELEKDNTFLLYGHLHNDIPAELQKDKSYYIGVDGNNFKPISIGHINFEILKGMKE